jgi:RNA polymerase sigma-70 factor (ECF subfamily)
VHTLSDEEILELILKRKQEERGFRALLEAYQERLYWHVRRMVTEHEDANDVLQNTFVKVYRNIGSFRQQSKLYTWLYRIATNESLTFLEKRKRRTSLALDEEESGLANRLEADSYFDGDEAQVRLQQALQTLPDKQRLVFNMRYFDEMSYQDISESLDTSVGALKASYHHAAKKIEKYILAGETKEGPYQSGKKKRRTKE